VQFAQSAREQFRDAQSGETSEDNAEFQTIRPILINNVSESNGIMSIKGTSHKSIKLAVQNFGDVLAEVRSDEDGVWAVDIPVKYRDTLNLQLIEYVTEDAPVLADEGIFRIPPPLLDEASLDQSPLPLIFVAAPGKPSSIFQSPFRGLPTGGGISMGSIDYDESGGVIFSGTSDISGRIRLFANNTAIGELTVGANGRWYFISADTLPAGNLTIGAAHITETGTLSQVEVFFERLTKNDGDISRPLEIFYQPYSWQVRRQLIGGGHQYTAIFAPTDAEAIIQQ